MRFRATIAAAWDGVGAVAPIVSDNVGVLQLLHELQLSGQVPHVLRGLLLQFIRGGRDPRHIQFT